MTLREELEKLAAQQERLQDQGVSIPARVSKRIRRISEYLAETRESDDNATILR